MNVLPCLVLILVPASLRLVLDLSPLLQLIWDLTLTYLLSVLTDSRPNFNFKMSLLTRTLAWICLDWNENCLEIFLSWLETRPGLIFFNLKFDLDSSWLIKRFVLKLIFAELRQDLDLSLLTWYLNLSWQTQDLTWTRYNWLRNNFDMSLTCLDWLETWPKLLSVNSILDSRLDLDLSRLIRDLSWNFSLLTWDFT